MERLAQSRLSSHIFSAPAFSNYQSAYRPGRSTETASLKIANDLLGNVATGSPSLLVSLDLSSAFDCVTHSNLIERLSLEFGFSGPSLNWVHSYISQRSYFVKVGEICSTSCPMISGVPQGSVLGPLLFSAYLSPISRLIHCFGLQHHIYADDITLIFTFDSRLSPLKLLNDCTSALSNWLMLNDLRLNPSKSEVVWAGTRTQLHSTDAFEPHLLIAGPVSSASSVKIVGVTFDAQLSFTDHVSEICRACNFHLRALSHIRRSLDIPTANMIATSIISSRLDYCNSLLAGISDFNLQRLQRLQNRAAKIVTNSWRTPTESLLHQLHWLPVSNRIDFKIATLTFKTLTTQQPSYLHDLLTPYSSNRSLRSSGQHLLTVPRSSTSIQSKAFSSYAPRLWNQLPQSLRDLAFASNTTLQSSVSTLTDPIPHICNLMTFR